MKLIEQTVLVFRKGRSEKVYEVDLCEVGEDRYVVNFRYGRRGSSLKDGSKTVAPVSEAEARQVYDKLVASKRDQGYTEGEAHAVTLPPPQPAAPQPAAPRPAAAQPTASPPSSAETPPAVDVPEDDDPRRQAVLARLARGDAPAVATGRPSLPSRLRHLAFRSRRPAASKDWSLSRAIWRAGELRIESAAPLLAGLVGTGDEMRDYCIAWALGMCRNPAGIPGLQALRSKARTPEKVRRIVTASLLELLDDDGRAPLLAELAGSLPPELGRLALEGPAEEVTKALCAHLSPSEEKLYGAQDPETWAAPST